MGLIAVFHADKGAVLFLLCFVSRILCIFIIDSYP